MSYWLFPLGIFFGAITSNYDRIQPWLERKIKNWGLRMEGESAVSTGSVEK